MDLNPWLAFWVCKLPHYTALHSEGPVLRQTWSYKPVTSEAQEAAAG